MRKKQIEAIKEAYFNELEELEELRKIYRLDRSDLQMRCAVEHHNGLLDGIKQTAELLGITL